MKRLSLLAAVLAAAQATAQQPPLLAPSQPVAGASQEEWSKRWWRWALSFDEEDASPLADPDGRFCGLGQSGPVWFLAGSFDIARTVRSCRVPAGKTLFFPLVSTLTMEPEDEDESCASLKRRAAAQADAPAGLVLEVNGRRYQGLAAHRQATRRCFHVAADDDTLAAGNGFYVALGPLRRGRYTLNFGGIVGDNSQAVTYTLEVE